MTHPKQTHSPSQLGRCWICARPILPNQRLAFDLLQAVRHHSCPKDKLIHALRDRAAARSCTASELLTARLAEMQRLIVQALGDLSYQQFYSPGPHGYLALHLSDAAFTISVRLSSVVPPDAIYHEELLTPGVLQPARDQSLGQITAAAARQGSPIDHAEAKHRLIDHLRTGPNHWDGRRKLDLSLEVLSTKGTAYKALSFAEHDQDLSLLTFAEYPATLQELSQQILGGPDKLDPKASLATCDPPHVRPAFL
jgi:hypothetical protein